MDIQGVPYCFLILDFYTFCFLQVKLYKQAEGIKGMLSLDDEVLGKITIHPTPLSSKVILIKNVYVYKKR